MMMFEWILIVPLILWLVGAFGRREERTHTGTSAQQILDERFARGEIDAEEFRVRRAALQTSATGGTSSSTDSGGRQ